MKPSISVIVPALNEEGNLESTIHDILLSLGRGFSSYELLLINDGSTDRTAIIADGLASENSNIKVIHHATNQGLGYSLREGFQRASKEYVMWYPGDNGMQQPSLAVMFQHTGKADLIIPYIANPEFRSRARRMVSQAYVSLLNAIFGLDLKYYNGVVIYRSDLIKKVKTSTQGFAFLAEALIRMIKEGSTYEEVPTFHRERSHGESKAFRLQNFLDVFRMIHVLLWDFAFRKPPSTADDKTPVTRLS